MPVRLPGAGVVPERSCHPGLVSLEADRPLLHPLLAARWSPTTFDASYELGASETEALLEAARWAPSAGNSQPWAFIVGQRGDATHTRLVRYLARSSGAWAPAASLLVANLAHRYVEGTDWEYSEFSLYDLGQAGAHMTAQAQALGLHVRQFRAFDRAGLAAEFAVPDHWEVTTMAAVGRPRQANAARSAPEPHPPARQADAPSRQRRSVDDIIWPVA
jgi:nitroreductase